MRRPAYTGITCLSLRHRRSLSAPFVLSASDGDEEHQMAATSPGSQNRLLRDLSREDYRSLAPHLQHVALSLHDVLVERNKTNHHVYFPLAGLIGVHTIFADHVSLDMVGKEGMVRIFIAAGVKAPHARIAVKAAARQCVSQRRNFGSSPIEAARCSDTCIATPV